MLNMSAAACASVESLVRIYTHSFDEDLDADGQPDRWIRTIDSGHPHYVSAGLDFTTSYKGAGSLKIAAGGAAAEYQSPWIEIDQHAAYDVKGFLKTENLPFSGLRATKAFIEVRLFDRSRALLAEIRGFPQASGTTDWTEVSLMDVARGEPRAAFLRVAVALEGRSLAGAVWFDEIEIKKRPIAFLTTNNAGNIFRQSDSKILSFEAMGLPEGQWDVGFTVEDDRGAHVHLVVLEALAGDDGRIAVTYRLPALSAGAYEITVQVFRDTLSGLTHRTRIGVLPDYRRRAPGKNFGISLTTFPGEESMAVDLAAVSGIGWIKMPLSDHSGDGTAERLRLITDLRRHEIMPAGVLEIPPATVRSDYDTDRIDWPQLFGETVNAFAGRLECWQLGADTSHPGLDAIHIGSFDDLKHFIDNVSFTSLCGMAVDRGTDELATGADFASIEASSFKSLAGAAGGTRPPGAKRWWVWMDLADWTYSDPEAATVHLAREIAGLFHLGAESIFFKDPWSRQGMFDSQGSISPFGLAALNLIHQLAGSTYSGAILLPGGTPNAIFTRGDETLLLLWPDDEPSEERIFLGEAVEVIDMFGRRRQAHRDQGENVIMVEAAPILLSGVNPAVVKLRQTFKVEPQVVDSIYQLQPVFMSFTNEFATPIAGELSATFPRHWEARPDRFFVRLGPGEVFRKQTNLLVPYNALSGPLEVHLTLDLGGGAQKTTLIRQIELGSTAFEMEIEIRESSTGIAVHQRISNISTNLLHVTAFLEGEGLERIEQPPRDLAAGSTTTFIYRLPVAGNWDEQTLRATVRDRLTDRFLNHEFVVQRDGGSR